MVKQAKEWVRSCRCAEVDESMVGQELTLMGWCHKQRNLGGLIYITLRDRSGELQIVVDEDSPAAVKEVGSTVRSEFVIAARGVLRFRSSVNPNMPTGKLELLASEMRIFSQAKTPPFYIEEDDNANETLRLEYRYLDLRRPNMQKKLILRHRITKFVRDFFDREGFLEIETPFLIKSTPEGARDYLVPSRVFPGEFFALPQSPQIYKQLLMVAGYDRYMQIVRCFRDEDLRADRQPEFTQVDVEMSFVNSEDVLALNERFIQALFREIKGVEIKLPLPRLTYAEAMRRFGSDKPDLRFGMELQDLSDTVRNSEFVVFQKALSEGGSVEAIVVPNGGTVSRKEIDKLGEYVKTYKAKGLAWLAPGEKTRGSLLKFFTPEELQNIFTQVGAEEGDLVLIVADPRRDVVKIALGELRLEVARKLDLIREEWNLLWVTEFPLLEYAEEEERYVAKHHPFTAPMDEDIEYLETEPARVRAKAYDMILNGNEIGGGSIRIYDADLQSTMFRVLGLAPEVAEERFGFLLKAFQYGVPPHGGIAYGLDRLVMLMTGSANIREVIAFPKLQNSSCLMSAAPSPVDGEQLAELGISLRESTEKVNGELDHKQ